MKILGKRSQGGLPVSGDERTARFVQDAKRAEKSLSLRLSALCVLRLSTFLEVDRVLS